MTRIVILGGGFASINAAKRLGSRSAVGGRGDAHRPQQPSSLPAVALPGGHGRVDPRRTRVVLLEAGERILPAFSEASAARAARDLEGLGAQVWTNSAVTHVAPDHLKIGDEVLRTHTVLWAAGVMASDLGSELVRETDRFRLSGFFA